MNKYIILIIILVLLLLFCFKRETFVSRYRKPISKILKELTNTDRCVDKFERCANGNLYTPPNSNGQIFSLNQTDCNNPFNPQAEARMWLNCCASCSKKVKNTPRVSKCANLLGDDENGESICEKKTREIGCGDLLDIVCCKTCSKMNSPKIIIDKNIKINNKVVLHANNFNQRTDLKNQANGVLKYASPQDLTLIRDTEDADIYFKERDVNGISFNYNAGKMPRVYLNNVEMSGDILNDILKYQTPYMVPLELDTNFDYETIDNYDIYNKDRMYEKLCFDNRTQIGDYNDVCLTSDHLKMLNGQRDIKIQNLYKNCLSTKTEDEKVNESGKHLHFWTGPKDDAPAGKKRDILYFGPCDNNNRNRFKLENIKKIKTEVKLV